MLKEKPYNGGRPCPRIGSQNQGNTETTNTELKKYLYYFYLKLKSTSLSVAHIVSRKFRRVDKSEIEI